MNKGIILGCLAIPVILTVGYFWEQETSDLSELNQPAEAQTSYTSSDQSDSEWAFVRTIDPLTDEKVEIVRSRYTGKYVDVDVEITCRNEQTLSYRFTTFDKDGTPSRMSKYPNALEISLGSNLIKRIDYQFRIDDQKAVRSFRIDPEHDNSLFVRSSNLKFRMAEILTVGLPSKNGQEPVRIDQSASPVNKVVDRCFDRTEIDDSDQTTSEEPSLEDASDDEPDFGGAVVGMMYPEFRKNLINAGFEPQKLNHTKMCVDGPDNSVCNYQFPETDSCSGTGEGYCTYLWSKGTDKFAVTTREHEAGEVVGMRFDR